MSASREKQNRKDMTASGYVAPKTAREAQQRKEERRSNLLYAVIGAAFVVVVIASMIWNSNIFSRSATALTVDGQKYSAAQVNFYYRNAYLMFMNQWSYAASYFGLNTSLPLDSQELNETAASFLDVELDADNPMTWKDYFLNEGINQLVSVQTALKQAADENFTFPDSVQTDYQESLDALSKSARSAGTTTRRYIQATFGGLISEGVYKAELMRLMQYDAYANAYSDTLDYDSDEISAAYDENKRDYDFVSYEAVSVDGSVETETDDDGNTVEPAEADVTAAKNTAKIMADALAAGARDGGTLSALSEGKDKTSPFSGDKESYESCTYTSDEFADWLFDDARKAGDVTVMENGDLYYVVKFNSRFRDETKTIDVRHILIQPESGELAEEDEGYQEEQDALKADAKAKAEQIYQEWQDGAATEESFATLAEVESDDPGSRSEGGLYERVYEGQMVTEFNDWCFDAARQPGDTDIVETSEGYHIMYFVGDNALVRWQVQVYDKLRSDAYEEWTKSLYENADVQRQESGMKYL